MKTKEDILRNRNQSWFSEEGEIEKSTGVKVWSEDPEECRAQGYPVKSSPAHTDNQEEPTQEELWRDIDNNYIRWNDQEIKLSELLQDFELRRRK